MESNAVLAEIARRLDVPLVDIVSRFDAESSDGIPGYELFQDSLHPNERGHELIAEALLEAFGSEFPPR